MPDKRISRLITHKTRLRAVRHARALKGSQAEVKLYDLVT